MSGVGTPIMKGRIIQGIDKALEDPKIDPDLTRLESLGNTLKDIGKSEMVIDNTHDHHVDVEWFGDDPNQSWWPNEPHKRLKTRLAYMRAIRIATRPGPNSPRPIVTYWIPGNTRYECAVAETPREVHVFWLTPPIGGKKYYASPDGGIQENMWMIVDNQRAAELKAMYPNTYDVQIEAVDGEEGLSWVKLMGC